MPRHSRISLFLAVIASCCCARAALAQTGDPAATAFRGTPQRAQGKTRPIRPAGDAGCPAPVPGAVPRV